MQVNGLCRSIKLILPHLIKKTQETRNIGIQLNNQKEPVHGVENLNITGKWGFAQETLVMLLNKYQDKAAWVPLIAVINSKYIPTMLK